MGVLLRLGAVELPQPRLADHLGQGLYHLLRGEGDGQVLEFLVIHGHDDEAEALHPVPLEVGEGGVHKGVGELDLPLASPAAEHHLVAVLDLPHGGSLFVHQSHRLQIVVGLTGLIGGLHGPGQGLAADRTAHNNLSFAVGVSNHSMGGKISSSWVKWLMKRSGRFSSVISWGFLPGYWTPMVMPRPAALAPTMSRARLSPT